MQVPSWPQIISAQASALAQEWVVFGVGALALTLLVWGLIITAAIRFRKTARNPQARSQKANNPPLEIAWTVAPLLLVTGLFISMYPVERSVQRPAPHPAIRVIAFRWGWTFEYAGGPTITGTAHDPPQLVLPLDRTVGIALASSDVDHAFWIPDMLFKRDAIPGRVTTFNLTPMKLGTYRGECGEFCGLDHALMTFSVRVVPGADYDRWRSSEGRR